MILYTAFIFLSGKILLVSTKYALYIVIFYFLFISYLSIQRSGSLNYNLTQPNPT